MVNPLNRGRQDPRPLALWSAPRALSHAFEKMMRARNDHTVFAEPFNDAWYFGPERGTHRDLQFIPDLTYASRLQPILKAAEEGRVFVRAQPWQFGKEYLNEDMLCRFHSSFLIRDPAYSFPSLYKIKPDFKEEEGGVTGLHKAWQIVLKAGERVTILDGTDVQRDPVNVVGAWCDAVGIPRNVEALNWKKGMNDSWSQWKQYVDVVCESTGFHSPPESLPVVQSERVARMIDSARPLYQEMACHKLLPTSTK